MYCETYHCQLSAAACRKRYRLASGSHTAGPVAKHLAGDLGCADCATGRRLAAADTALPAAAARPIPTQTTRREPKMSEKQAQYGPAAKTAVCKKCGAEKELKKGFYKMAALKTGYDRTCKQCRNARKKTLQKNMQQALREKHANRGKDNSAAGHAPAPAPLILEIDLPAELYEQIVAAAGAELRTPENQVLYWLRRAAAGKESAWLTINNK